MRGKVVDAIWFVLVGFVADRVTVKGTLRVVSERGVLGSNNII